LANSAKTYWLKPVERARAGRQQADAEPTAH
jgi:hypothetical protein